MVDQSHRTAFAAWLVCGPVGHFWCGVLDWGHLGRHYTWSRVRGRDPWERFEL